MIIILKIYVIVLYKPGLYIVSTPIGNLKDITLRAIEVLQNSNYIFCEDTRITNKLLGNFKIKGHLFVYADYSQQSVRELIKSFILKDNVVSLVSSAGTPLISDPGFKLLKFLRQDNIYIDVIPGVSSPIAALTISGLPTDKFFFGGFIPKHSKKQFFYSVKKIAATLIFFDSVNRILDSLYYINEILGNRLACVVRELTKIHQEIKFDQILNLINDISSSVNFKGEVVLLIEGYMPNKEDYEKIINFEIKKLISEGKGIRNIIEILYPKYEEFYSRKSFYSIIKNIYKYD